MHADTSLGALRRAGSCSTDELFRRLRRTGDAAAREELVRRFLPLARKLAGRYPNPYEPLDDQLQVASMGLLAAVDRFDPDRGVAFHSYAIPTILGELKRYFRGGWAVHVPRNAQELALRVTRAERDITGETGRSPSVQEIAVFLELSIEDVLCGLEAAQAHYSRSLEAPARRANPDVDGEPLYEAIGSEDEGFALVETTGSLAATLAQLPYSERQALRLRIEEDLKQTEIAQRMGCSQMQVSRLLRRATTKAQQRLDPNLHDRKAGLRGPEGSEQRDRP